MTQNAHRTYARTLVHEAQHRASPARAGSTAGDAAPPSMRAEDARLAEDLAHHTDHARLQGQEAAAAIEAADRARDEGLAFVSHEMRSPLAAITIWASLLRMGTLSPEKAAQAVAAIERNAAILSRFIGELLDVSRIVSGKLAMDVQPVDLAAVAGAALDTVRTDADAKDIRLETLIDSSARVAGDSIRLQQVVCNLLTNAVKFSDRGGRVVLRVVTEDARAVISVKDEGEGIAANHLAQIFERYRQANDASARVHGGLGLGLAIVREIVKLHRGAVQVESAGPGHGATFTVTLPSLDSPDALHLDAAAVDVAGPALGTGSILAGVRVLLVENDAGVRTTLRAALELNGASVTTAASAAEAAERLSRDHPDVLVSDVTTPESAAEALVRRLRGLEADDAVGVPAAAATVHAATDEAYQLRLTRPVDATALVSAVARLVGASPCSQETLERNGAA
jgi:signal transduction histidine kinase/CheY-like chemotaxis protein